MSTMNIILNIPAGTTNIKVPLTYTISTSVSINWGDTSSNTWTVNADASTNPTHVYNGAQTPTVTITSSGANGSFGSQTANMAQYITSVTQWGTIGITNYSYAFYNGSKLTSIPTASPPNTPNPILSMAYMFYGCSTFNQAINFTTSSSLNNTNNMFKGCVVFNNTVSISNLTGVTDMSNMFNNCYVFNQPINFTTSNQLTNLNHMFYACVALNSIITISNVTAVSDMSYMFYNAGAFNKSISYTTSSALTNLSNMFYGCRVLNSGVTFSDLTGVTNMSSMFQGCIAFNQPINFTTSGQLTNISSMFRDCSVLNNSTLIISNVTNVTTMFYMFYNATAFNQPINFTTSGQLTNLNSMFIACTAFNSAVTISNTTNVTDMSLMFCQCSNFNQPINFTTTNALTSIGSMFVGCSKLNSPITISNTTKVTSMYALFSGCSAFNQLILLNVSSISGTSIGSIFQGTALTIDIYSAIVSYFVQYSTLATGIDMGTIGTATVKHYNIPAFTTLSSKGWTYTDGGVSTVTPMALNITLPSSLVYPYTSTIPLTNSSGLSVYWGDGSMNSVLSHSYASSGTYSITIVSSGTNSQFGTGTTPTFSQYITTLSQWGSIGINNLSYACYNATGLLSVPTLPIGLTNMSYMFKGCTSFNYPVKINISSISSGTISLLGTGLLDMFCNTGLSVKNYSTILNYFSYGTVPIYLNLGRVSDSTDRLLQHSTTSSYPILISSPNFWTITDGGTNIYSTSPTNSTYNPVQIKNTTDSTTSSNISDSLVLTKAYNTSEVSTSGIIYNTTDNTSVGISYNGQTVANCLNNLLNVGTEFTNVMIGNSTNLIQVGNITHTGNTLGSSNGTLNIHQSSGILNINSSTCNINSTNCNVVPTTCNINPTTLQLFSNQFRYVPWTVYNNIANSGTVFVKGTITNPTFNYISSVLTASYSIIGNTMHINYYFYQGSNTSTALGNGAYLFPFPSGYMIDDTKVVTWTNNGGSSPYCSSLGTSWMWYPGNNNGMGGVFPYISGGVSYLVIMSETFLFKIVGYGGSSYAYESTLLGLTYKFTATVPIV